LNGLLLAILVLCSAANGARQTNLLPDTSARSKMQPDTDCTSQIETVALRAFGILRYYKLVTECRPREF
jgi:hypothetical protein